MEVVEKDILRFQETIRNNSGYSFDDYSPTSLRRRLTRILLEHDMDMEQLTSQMDADPDFLEHTVKKITVHTTELFRDPEVWKKMGSELLRAWKHKPVIRIWRSARYCR